VCSLELSDIEQQIWRPYRDKGVQVLGMSGGGLFDEESRKTVTNFRNQTSVTFPLVLGDETRPAYGKFRERISPFPFDVVVDKKGRIRYVGTRFDRAGIVALIERLLAEPD
jgi:peroxiredoxin